MSGISTTVHSVILSTYVIFCFFYLFLYLVVQIMVLRIFSDAWGWVLCRNMLDCKEASRETSAPCWSYYSFKL